MKVFSVLGVPDVLHSDQGQNFENTILKETLEAFGVEKSHTTAYHPQGDGNGKAIASRFSHSRRQVLHLISIKHDIVSLPILLLCSNIVLLRLPDYFVQRPL